MRPHITSKIFPVQIVFLVYCAARAQALEATNTASIYQELKEFSLGYASLPANNLVLKKDRATLTFEKGTFYFSSPVAGKMRSAVFIGEGTFHADVPPSEFEKDNVKRLLKAEDVTSNFKSAVLRFTDDTQSELGQVSVPGTPPTEEARKLAEELDRRVLEETGANLSARQLISIVNHESPGFFFAQ